jgi:hypothetical protein
MICPSLTYADMHKAVAEIAEVFQMQIVRLGQAASRTGRSARRHMLQASTAIARIIGELWSRATQSQWARRFFVVDM